MRGYFTLDNRGNGVVKPKPNETGGYWLAAGVASKLGLRPSDEIIGLAQPAGPQQKFPPITKILTINGVPASAFPISRPRFDNASEMTTVFPDQMLRCETTKERLTGRFLDLITPIGKGQRALLVAPPKAGKTTILKEIAYATHINNPDVHIVIALIGERPEEVTDFMRTSPGEIFFSNFDDPLPLQQAVAELALERAKRLCEMGRDVLFVMDSLTRLARAYNQGGDRNSQGRTMSGGVDQLAVQKARTFLGAARNVEHGGSVTIVGSCLINTDSRMDDVIYADFKGTGNCDIVLDRALQERRVFPAINLKESSTRNEALLLGKEEAEAVIQIRRMLSSLNGGANEQLLKQLSTTVNNAQLFERLRAGSAAAETPARR